MTPRTEIPPAHPKSTKRKRQFSINTAMKLTCGIIKKFREIFLDDDKDLVPFKKRKISKDKINESSNDADFPLSVTNSLPSLTVSEKESVQNANVIKSPPLHVTISSKECGSKQFITIKKKSPEKIIKQLNNIKQKSPEKSSKIRNAKLQLQPHVLKTTTIIKEDLVFEDFLFTTTIRSLIIRFEKCVSFIRPSRLPKNVDIDNIVRSFSIFGKVVSIQDHWARPKKSLNQYPSVWLGATVTYRSTEDLKRVVKAFSLEKSPVLCVPLFEHLSRISSVELEYIHQHQTSKFNGTTIVIENIYPRTSRSKFHTEFELYGSVSNVKWIKLGDLKCSCEVTYITTTNAVAAALALDGKTVQRSILRVKIKLTAREIFIHRKLCEMS